jgi:ribosomal protein S3AE
MNLLHDFEGSAAVPVLRGIAFIRDYVRRFATARRDRIGAVIEVVARQITRELRIEGDLLHRDAKEEQRRRLRLHLTGLPATVMIGGFRLQNLPSGCGVLCASAWI